VDILKTHALKTCYKVFCRRRLRIRLMLIFFFVGNNLGSLVASKVMFPRSKVPFLRRETGQSDVLSDENEVVTQFPPVKVRNLRAKVRFLRAIFDGSKRKSARERRF
jgi:hypothetical protein